MDMVDWLGSFGIPGLQVAARAVEALYTAVQDVQVHEAQCWSLYNRCNVLLFALQESSSPDTIDPRTQEAIDNATGIIEKIQRKMQKWAALSTLQALAQSDDIASGITQFENELDTCVQTFHIGMGLDIRQQQRTLLSMNESYHDEMRGEMRAILNYLRPILAILQAQSVPPAEPMSSPGDDFLQRFSQLHIMNERLPPFPDFTRMPNVPVPSSPREIPPPTTSQSSFSSSNQSHSEDPAVGAANTPQPTRNRTLPPQLKVSVDLTPGSSNSVPRPSPNTPGTSPPDSPELQTPSLRRPSSLNIGLYAEIGALKSLQELIESLTTRGENMKPEDLTLQRIFLTTNPVFCEPSEVLPLLKQRYTDAPGTAEAKAATRYLVLDLLYDWLSGRHFGPTHKDALVEVREFVKSIVPPSEFLSSRASHIAQMVDRTLKRLNPPSTAPTSPISPTSPLPPPTPTRSMSFDSRSIISSTLSTRAPSARVSWPSKTTPETLAQHLTLLESSLLAKVSPADFIAYLLKLPGPTALDRLRSFNADINTWVQHVILQTKDQSKRTDLVRKFIEVAHHCESLCNFSGIQAVATALDSGVIRQLKYTWEGVSKKHRDTLSRLLALISGFDLYKEAWDKAAGLEVVKQKAAKQKWLIFKQKAPKKDAPKKAQSRVPYLFVHLRDLEELHQQDPSLVKVDQQSLVNWAKCIRMSELVDFVLDQSLPYTFERRQDLYSELDRSINSVVADTRWENETSSRLFAQEKIDYPARAAGFQ